MEIGSNLFLPPAHEQIIIISIYM